MTTYPVGRWYSDPAFVDSECIQRIIAVSSRGKPNKCILIVPNVSRARSDPKRRRRNHLENQAATCIVDW
jgi:hypothetical protein